MKSYLTLHYTCYIYQVISKEYITLETSDFMQLKQLINMSLILCI